MYLVTKGLIGSATQCCLGSEGYKNLIARTRSELNLMDAQAVNALFEVEKP